ncbi:hypothetical protein ACF06Q_26090 [Streptomyces leeuwenhoekii]|uniref:hypothetical protein n=1 Tax=Streptomyces leeuwenhoekii TaxID=1437453 RepID=UPI0036F5240D
MADALPKLPILPYVQRPLPPHLFRFDLREPDEIFADGFWSWGTGLDLCRHVADFRGYQRLSGFVSTASDTTTAMNMFISWKVEKEELTKAWDIDLKRRKCTENWSDVLAQIKDQESRDRISVTPQRHLARLATLYLEEYTALKKIEKVADDSKRAAWVEGWMYVIKPDPHCISVEDNLRDPRRRHLTGGRAYKLSGEATEWDAVIHVPPQLVRQAVKVRFTRIKTTPGKLATLVHDVGLDIATNKEFDANFAYDPYLRSQGRFAGLIGYWAPVDLKATPSPYGPGSKNFVKLSPDVWSGKDEYKRAGGPRYPFGRPEEIQPAYPAFARKP